MSKIIFKGRRAKENEVRGTGEERRSIKYSQAFCNPNLQQIKF